MVSEDDGNGADDPHREAPERPDKPSAVSRLDQPVQEHLGKQLRSTYNVLTDKPTFLGEAALPPQFDGLIHKLEQRDRQRSEAIHDKAVAAVETALQDVIVAPPKPDDGGGFGT